MARKPSSGPFGFQFGGSKRLNQCDLSLRIANLLPRLHKEQRDTTRAVNGYPRNARIDPSISSFATVGVTTVSPQGADTFHNRILAAQDRANISSNLIRNACFRRKADHLKRMIDAAAGDFANGLNRVAG